MSLEQELKFNAEAIRTLQGSKPGYAFSSIHEFVLAKGQAIESRPLARDQKMYLKRTLRFEGGKYPMRECFANSQRVLLADTEERLAYYEGYATSGLMAVLHGWLMMDGETLIDLTWRKRRDGVAVSGSVEKTRILGELPEGYEYRGLEVANQEAVRAKALRTETWSCFLDDWRGGYPLLRG